MLHSHPSLMCRAERCTPSPYTSVNYGGGGQMFRPQNRITICTSSRKPVPSGAATAQQLIPSTQSNSRAICCVLNLPQMFLHPRTGHEGREGPRLGWVVNATPRSLNPRGKRPATHCIGGWVDSRASPDGYGKSRPPTPRFDPRTVQPVASRYTD